MPSEAISSRCSGGGVKLAQNKGRPSVIAANTRQSKKQVLRAMLARQTLDPDTALDWGLVHEIRQELFPEGTEVIPIQTGG